MLVGYVCRQRKRKDRRKALRTSVLLTGVGLVVCGILSAVMIPIFNSHESSHDAKDTKSILSLCDQNQYDQWCEHQVESAKKEWQALKEKYSDGSLTLVCTHILESCTAFVSNGHGMAIRASGVQDYLIGHLDTALYYLRPAMDLSELYSSVAVTEACRSSASQCTELASSQYLQGYSDPVILEAILETVKRLKMSSEKAKLINDTIRIFHNSGAGLSKSQVSSEWISSSWNSGALCLYLVDLPPTLVSCIIQRKAFAAMSASESKYANAFDSVLDSDERYVNRSADDSMALEGLPLEFIKEHTKDGVVTFGTVYSDLDSVLDFAVNETLRKVWLISCLLGSISWGYKRECVYIYIQFDDSSPRPLPIVVQELLVQYLKRGTPENLASLQSLISVRQEIAKAVNKTSWAQLKSDGLMLHDVDEIENFLQETYNAVAEHTITYQQSLLQLKQSSVSTGQVLDPDTIWQYDRDFWKGVLQENLFNYSEDGLSQYLEYDKVKQALFGVFEDVFGVQLSPALNEYKYDG